MLPKEEGTRRVSLSTLYYTTDLEAERLFFCKYICEHCKKTFLSDYDSIWYTRIFNPIMSYISSNMSYMNPIETKNLLSEFWITSPECHFNLIVIKLHILSKFELCRSHRSENTFLVNFKTPKALISTRLSPNFAYI